MFKLIKLTLIGIIFLILELIKLTLIGIIFFKLLQYK